MSILRYGLDDDDNGYLTYHCQKDSSTILVSGADGSGKYSKGYVGVIDTRSTSKNFAHKYYGKYFRYQRVLSCLSIILNKH